MWLREAAFQGVLDTAMRHESSCSHFYPQPQASKNTVEKEGPGEMHITHFGVPSPPEHGVPMAPRPHHASWAQSLGLPPSVQPPGCSRGSSLVPIGRSAAWKAPPGSLMAGLLLTAGTAPSNSGGPAWVSSGTASCHRAVTSSLCRLHSPGTVYCFMYVVVCTCLERKPHEGRSCLTRPYRCAAAASGRSIVSNDDSTDATRRPVRTASPF